LHGLVSRPELNYRVGNIVHHCQSTNRFAVSLDDFPLAAPVLVKAVNISPIQDDLFSGSEEEH
jgi:hypothetical protein